MRRIGGVLFLVLGATFLTACGDEPEPIADVATTTTEIAPTTSTTLAPTTTVAPTTTILVRPTTSTTAARPATTVTRVTPTSSAPSDECDPNYSGACVPVDSDVDCGGGSGNGPSYVYAKNFRVIGDDIYGLDGNDNDGLACES